MTSFDLFYINLDSATDRRAAVEASHAKAGFSSNWTFNRFPAYGKTSIEVLSTPGQQTPAYKGNFLSHINCIERMGNPDSHLMICEDDCDFAPGCGDYIEKLVAQLPDDKWDVLFTEISFMSWYQLPIMMKLKQKLSGEALKLIPLEGFKFPFTGSSSYVVNKKSRGKILELLSNLRSSIDHPYDVCLRACIDKGNLQGFLIFPFIVAPSIHANETQAPCFELDGIQAFAQKLQMETLNSARRMLAIHYNGTVPLSPVYQNFFNTYEYNQEEKNMRDIMYWGQAVQALADYNELSGIKVLSVDLPLKPVS
ncbi:hypothetical protein [Niveispirillum sp. BGYR6]|uniref:hypothetical protein n=1 Tax=Niveispirillum sp. BGYR6 TaxID=2971249 RepID=UPI0022B969D8|nr:hypothetical protein [Niveispirillum sp. BGYR6]MDG5496775.1 hypothetical protein [Niveispirillum sp. BGYR6]